MEITVSEDDIWENGHSSAEETIYLNVVNSVMNTQTFTYNADGQMRSMVQHGSEGGFHGEAYKEAAELAKILYGPNVNNNEQEAGTYENPGQFTLEQADNARLYQSTRHDYDTSGRLDYTRTQSSRETTGFDYTYEARESYLEETVTGRNLSSGKKGSYIPAKTTSFYDASGNRVAIEESLLTESGSRDRNYDIQARHFDYSADGKLLQKTTGSQHSSLSTVPSMIEEPVWDESSLNPSTGQPWDDYEEPEDYISRARTKDDLGFEERTTSHQDSDGHVTERTTGEHYLHVGSQYLGELQESGKIDVKSAHFSGIEARSADSSKRHVVEQGDTLARVATLYYGSADFWYVIADANGLSVDAQTELNAGQTLEIPQHVNNENSFDSYTAYNITQQIGETLPSVAYVPPPPEAQCNAIATAVIVVVSVVAAYYGQAWVAGALEGAAGAGVAAGAAGGAIGSAAGQTAAIAMDEQDGYNLDQIATSAVAGGIAGGIAEGAGVGSANEGDAISGISEYSNSSRQVALTAGGRALTAAASTAGAAATNRILGNPSGFSWANVAASAVGAAAGSSLPNEVNSEGLISNFGSNMIGSAAAYATSKLVNNEGSWDFEQVAADAFGNALGNEIIRQETAQAVRKQADEIQEKMSRYVSEVVNRNVDSQMGSSLNQTMTSLSEQTNRMLWALDRNAGIEANVSFEASVVASQNAGAQRASSYVARSGALNLQGNILGSRHLQQMQGIYANANNAFMSGVARGEAMYAAGVRNREQIGVDFTQFNNQVDGSVNITGSGNNRTLNALNDYITFSQGSGDLSKMFGIQTLPTTFTNAVDDWLIGGAAGIGSRTPNGTGLMTHYSTTGKEIGVAKPNSVRGYTYIENDPINRIKLQGSGGWQSYAAGAARRGGVLGAITAPIGSVINAKINGDPILDPNGIMGLDANFAQNASLDVGKGVIGGATGALAGAYVGAAIGTSIPILGTAVGFAVGFGVGYLVSEYGVETFYESVELRPKR